MTPRQQHDLNEIGMYVIAIILIVAAVLMVARMGG